MKRLMVAGGAALVAAMAFDACAMSLPEAYAKMGGAIGNVNEMASVVSQLSASDQVAFLGRVNAAIADMPGKPEEKVAKYLDANKAAVKAAKGNRTALLAETYATVPPEALAVINERFASELFDRNANPANPMSDERLVEIAKHVMDAVKARTATVDSPDVRNAFAALMFIRASDGSPESLRETLVNELSAGVRDTARNEWFPAALGEGRPKSYEPMLGASGTDADQPDFDIVARLASAESPVALLADLDSKPGEIATVRATLGPGFAGLPVGMGDGSGLDRVPRTVDSSDKWFGGLRRGEGEGEGGGGGGGNCRWVCEPGGYNCQLICS